MRITRSIAMLSVLLSLGSSVPVFAATQNLNLQSQSYVVLQDSTGKFLQSYNADAVVPIASLTKLMTALVVLDTKPNWDSRVTYKSSDNREGARLRIGAGDTTTVRDLWYSMLVGSANNATVALVRSTGLTQAQFVSRMNAKAQALGLTATSFVEPTGLDANNVSTAKEYALLARTALRDSLIQKATTTKVYSFRTGKRFLHTIKNSDKILISGTLAVKGGKTGYTEEAGYNMVLKAKVAGKGDVLTVVMKNPSSASRFAEAKKLVLLAATL